MCLKLWEWIFEENEKQLDFLEIIWIFRGIFRYEFYKDLLMEGFDFEFDFEEIMKKMEFLYSFQLQFLVYNEDGDNEVLFEEEEENEKEDEEMQLFVVVVEKREEVYEQNCKKRLIFRVDFCWFVGYKYYIKLVEQKYFLIYLKLIYSKI